MNKKIAVLGLIGLFSMAGTSLAAGVVTKADLLARSPIYLVVEIGKRTVCDPNYQYFAACPLTNSPEANLEYSGSVQVTGGTMTVAKEILIDSDETLTNSVQDTGKPSAEIDFDFKTPYYKGMVIKLQPDLDFTDGKLVFSEKKDGVLVKSLEIPFNELENNSELKSAGNFTVENIYFPSTFSLKDRNASFQKKLIVTAEMMKVEKWARDSYIAGKISEPLYQNFRTLTEMSWLLDYNDTDYFRRRYGFLKANFNNKKATAALFYGGLSQLMKKVMN